MTERLRKNLEKEKAVKNVLFLCTGNSCRSQMAEAWVNTLRESEWQAYSAGIETHGMNKSAVAVMSEIGIDISQHYSKHIDDVANQDFDLIVTVCDHAAEHCPALEKHSANHITKIVHVPFDDPPKLAKSASNDEEALDSYRLVRDQIRTYVESKDFGLA